MVEEEVQTIFLGILSVIAAIIAGFKLAPYLKSSCLCGSKKFELNVEGGQRKQDSPV